MKIAMMTSTIALCISFALFAGPAVAANSPKEPWSQGGSQEIGYQYGPKGGEQNTSLSGKGHPRRPPQEAIEACNGMSDGDRVEFETPHGHIVSGTCKEMDGMLFAIPEGGPPPSSGRDQRSRGQRE